MFLIFKSMSINQTIKIYFCCFLFYEDVKLHSLSKLMIFQVTQKITHKYKKLNTLISGNINIFFNKF